MFGYACTSAINTALLESMKAFYTFCSNAYQTICLCAQALARVDAAAEWENLTQEEQDLYVRLADGNS